MHLQGEAPTGGVAVELLRQALETHVLAQETRRFVCWNPAVTQSVVAAQHNAARNGAMFFPWYETLMLAAESNRVIALRLAKMACGGMEARDEALLMVSEKVDAAREAHTTLMAGGSVAVIVDRYREHVASNEKRLRLN